MIRVNFREHPASGVVSSAQLDPLPTLGDTLGQARIDLRSCVITCGGVLVTSEDLLKRTPSEGVYEVVQRPGAAIAVGAIAGIIAGQSVATVVVNGIIVYGLSLLAKAMAPPAPEEHDELKSGIRTSVTGDANRSAQYQLTNVNLGQNRVYPVDAATPYNSVRNGKLFGHYLFTCGKGPQTFRNVRVDEDNVFNEPLFKPSTQTHYRGNDQANTGLLNGNKFTGVQLEFVKGGLTGDDDYDFQTYSNNVEQVSIQVPLIQAKSWVGRTAPANSTALDIIVGCPGGLYRVTNQGKTVEARVKAVVQYIDKEQLSAGSGSWTTVTNGQGKTPTFNFKAKTKSSVYRNIVITGLDPDKLYEVRVRRSNADPTDPGEVASLQWDAIVATQSSTAVLEPGMSLIGLTVRLSDQFPNGIQGLNVVAEAHVRRYTEATGLWGSADLNTWGYSSNPAELFRHVLQGPSNARPVDDSEIDLDRLGEWYSSCREQGEAIPEPAPDGATDDGWLQFNRLYNPTGGRTIDQVLREICAAAKASLSYSNGQFSVVEDLPLAGGGYGQDAGFGIAVVNTSGSDVVSVTINAVEAVTMVAGESYALRYLSTNGWRVHAVNTVAGSQTLLTFTNPIEQFNDQPIAGQSWTFGKDTAPAQLFTPKNSWNFACEWQYVIQPEGVKVGYVEKDNDTVRTDAYFDNDILVAAEGFTLATAEVLDSLQLKGVTSREQGFTLAKYHLAVVAGRTAKYLLNTDWENLNCVRGDWVRVQHDVILEGLAAGRLLSVTTDGGGNATSVTIDEPVTMSVVNKYGIHIRNSDESKTYLRNPILVNAVNGEVSSLTFTVPIPVGSLPEVGDLFAFSRLDQEIGDYRVQEIVGESELEARLVLVDAMRERINELFFETFDGKSVVPLPLSTDTPASSALAAPVLDEPTNEDPPSGGGTEAGSERAAGTATVTISVATPTISKRKRRRRRRRRRANQ